MLWANIEIKSPIFFTLFPAEKFLVEQSVAEIHRLNLSNRYSKKWPSSWLDSQC